MIWADASLPLAAELLQLSVVLENAQANPGLPCPAAQPLPWPWSAWSPMVLSSRSPTVGRREGRLCQPQREPSVLAELEVRALEEKGLQLGGEHLPGGCPHPAHVCLPNTSCSTQGLSRVSSHRTPCGPATQALPPRIGRLHARQEGRERGCLGPGNLCAEPVVLVGQEYLGPRWQVVGGSHVLTGGSVVSPGTQTCLCG